MMNIDEINRQKVMQLATAQNGHPWICTVYFVLHEGSFYWLSFPERRHSRELAENPNAAITVVVKRDMPVIGVQSEGSVAVVDSISEIEQVVGLYTRKYGQGEHFVELYKAEKNHHVLYRMRPRKTIVFDEMNSAGSPIREIPLTYDANEREKR